MTQITQRTVSTRRLSMRILEVGRGDDVVFVHGNLSNADVWHEQLEQLAPGLHGIAPDLRGFGATEAKPIDASRGLRDFSDDVIGLLDELDVARAHIVGHSMGGGVAMQMAIDNPERVASLVLFAPVSPYGFGGTFADGSPCTADFAGSGGGMANPDLVSRIRNGDRTADTPASPLSVVRTLYFPEPEAVRDEERLLEGILQTRIGDDFYPGDSVGSVNWPGVAAGTRGVLNTMTPRFCNLTAIADPRYGGPILWIRGDRDAIVSNTSMTDLGYLGAIGAVPGWPGENVMPAQPMVDQTREVLQRRGNAREEVFPGAGHFVFTERPQECADLIDQHVRSAE